MRTRQEIKEHAKQAFAAQRGDSILSIFLVMLIPFGLGILSSIPTFIAGFGSAFTDQPNQAMVMNIVLLSLGLSIVSIAVSILMVVLEVNLSGTFVKVYYGQQITFSEPFTTIKQNFGRKLGGMFWMVLWIYLWMLVGMFSFFIPTIIKVLSYSMTPYILASNPNVTATEALSISKRMTKGHKGKIFVMYLSFIGWQLLNGLTFGILGILYVNPYMYTSIAGLFVELRGYAVATGTIHPAELDGVSAYYPQPQYPQAPQIPAQPQYPPAQPFAPYPPQQPIQTPPPPPVPQYTQQPLAPQQPEIAQPPIPSEPPIPEPQIPEAPSAEPTESQPPPPQPDSNDL